MSSESWTAKHSCSRGEVSFWPFGEKFDATSIYSKLHNSTLQLCGSLHAHTIHVLRNVIEKRKLLTEGHANIKAFPEIMKLTQSRNCVSGHCQGKCNEGSKEKMLPLGHRATRQLLLFIKEPRQCSQRGWQLAWKKCQWVCLALVHTKGYQNISISSGECAARIWTWRALQSHPFLKEKKKSVSPPQNAEQTELCASASVCVSL